MIYNVLVKPGAKKDSVEVNEDNITIRTTARAHDNEANEAVIKLLSKHFRIAKGQVKIMRGEKSKKKIVDIL